ncbi:bacterio-opsin activator [Halobacteriales archaeon QH_6_66_25]|nr:MAG: bacterio-opsin activator [Halobacteriales archaeon QH_6_66_25]
MLRAKLYFELEKQCILSEVTDPIDGSFAVSQEEVHDDHMITFLIDTGKFSSSIAAKLEASEQVTEVERIDDRRLLVTKRSCGALPVIRRNHGKLRGMDRVSGSQRVFDILVFRRDDLKQIVEELNDIGTVSLGQLSPYDERGGTLSARQAEVVELALDHGYFEWPRETDAEALAEKLDIAHPTLLEHLRKAEKKLLVEALDHGSETASPPKERAFMLEEPGSEA